ncbi:MAG: hypothetical protein EBU31_18680, partial [Proteobacteria bacterium]|nr:hypothetical protein [Pseudomonadota bacterium]
TRIDPLPDKRLAMAEPRAVLYGDGGRIVTMRADAMTARVPKRALESGKLTGNVVIRIYRSRNGAPVDLKNDAPDVTVESPEAAFDQASGEIRCDRQVRIAGEVIVFNGEGLSLTLSADGKNIERLVVDRALEPVRISRSAVEAQSKKRAKEAAEAPAQAGAGAGAAADGAKGTDAPATAVAVAQQQPAAPAAPGKKGAGKAAAPAGPRLFLLTLYDDVEVISYEGDRTTTVRGDRLDSYFIMKGGSGMSLAARDPFGPPSAPFPEVALPGNRASQLAALAFAAAPDDDALVTVSFTGRLVMAPAPEGTPTLGQPEGVRMVVNGRPARIEDSKSQAVLQAKRISLESKVDR